MVPSMGQTSKAVAKLPVLPSTPAIRRSRTSRWRAAVLIAVHVLMALHIAHWLTAGETMTPLEPSEAMAFSKGSVVNAGLIFFAAMILSTAVFGRFFCGWACHLVALQDLCRWLLEKVGIRPRPLRSRMLLWVPLGAFVYMFIWPLVYRLAVGDPLGPVGKELTTSEFWATFPGWVIGGITFLVCGFVCVYVLGAKGFCTYGCPYGAAFAMADRVSPLRIRVTDACAGCGHCTAVCTSNVRVHEEVRDYGMVVDPGCMKCMDCVSVCPSDALYYGAGPLPPRGAASSGGARPLPWKEEAVLAVAFLAAFFSFRGLYGSIPFLLSLGWSGVLAYTALVGYRLATRPHASFRGFRLKRQGRLQPQGKVALAILVLVALLWGHSAFVRSQEALAARQLAGLAPHASAVLDPKGAALAPADRRQAGRQAVRHLERARRWGLVEHPDAVYDLAWAHAYASDWSESAASARAALEREGILRGPQEAAMESLLGKAAVLRGDPSAAVEHYRRAAAAAPQDASPLLSLGFVLADRGDLAGAGRAFEEGLARSPESESLFYNLALVRAMTGEAEQAVALFQEVLQLNPQNLEARENLAGVLASLGRFEESVEHYRAALRQSPGDPETHVFLARALIGAGRLQAAVPELQEALRLDPGNRTAQVLLADLTSSP